MKEGPRQKPWAKLTLISQYRLTLSVAVLIVLSVSEGRTPLNLPAYSGSEKYVNASATLPPMSNPETTGVPTYDVAALNATAAAIVPTLPTPSPIPYLPTDKAESYQINDVWNRAYATALALYPRPPGYIQWEAFTPVVPLTPWPTSIVHTRNTLGGTIYDERYLGPPCNLIITTNHWYGQVVGGDRTHICAGADKRNPNLGVIVIEVWPANQQRPGRPDNYYSPTQSGTLRIEDVLGQQVILRVQSGNLIYFDMISRQWTQTPPMPTPSLPPVPTPSVLP